MGCGLTRVDPWAGPTSWRAERVSRLQSVSRPIFWGGLTHFATPTYALNVLRLSWKVCTTKKSVVDGSRCYT